MCRIKRWNRRWGYNEDTDGEQEYGMYTENCCHANQWLHLLLLKMQLLICCTGGTAEHMISDCHGASSNSLSNGVPGEEITPRGRDMCPIQYHSQKV
jgi:hypothetical protein